MEREQLLALAESMMGMAIDNLRRDGYVAFATLVFPKEGGMVPIALWEHLDLPRLARELDHWQRASQQQPVIVMSVRFPVDYPKSVPFVRMIKPRFKWHTGHVTVGGSMCTELLTPGGWQPMTVHALLLTVCQMLRQGEAQIQLKPDEHCMWPLKDYSEMEAREAYERVAKFHGWPTQRRHS